MEKRSHILRRILVIVILSVMALPILQDKFFHLPFPPLKGAIVKLKEPTFTFSKWFDESFQKQRDKYNTQTFGYHDILVRIYHQFLYNFYRKAGAKYVVIGKDNYLYEENYINASYGTDFIGTDSINRRMEMAKYIQDTLAKLNKTFLFVFAPSKASYYPEYIPDRFSRQKRITNYSQYIKTARELGIHYIDFNDYFIRQKPVSTYPLMPKYGIHWSYYGMCLAVDSMVKYIQHARNIDMPGIYWDTIFHHLAKNEDYDIGDGLNLLVPIPKDTLAYPNLLFENPQGRVKPSALIIGDSFYFVMYGVGSKLFKHSQFWYYNKEVYSMGSETRNISDIDLKRELRKHDIIIIMGAEATLPNLGWGFIENSYRLYHDHFYIPGRDSIFNARVNKLVRYIRTDKEWMKRIAQKASDRSISKDSMLRMDAVYEVDLEENK